MSVEQAVSQWPKFRLRPWVPSEPSRILTREEAKAEGFNENDLIGLERRSWVGTENKNRGHLSLYTQEDAVRDAAPEMLKALRLAQEWFSTTDPTVGPLALLVIKTIRDAISKATGEYL